MRFGGDLEDVTERLEVHLPPWPPIPQSRAPSTPRPTFFLFADFSSCRSLWAVIARGGVCGIALNHRQGGVVFASLMCTLRLLLLLVGGGGLLGRWTSGRARAWRATGGTWATSSTRSSASCSPPTPARASSAPRPARGPRPRRTCPRRWWPTCPLPPPPAPRRSSVPVSRGPCTWAQRRRFAPAPAAERVLIREPGGLLYVPVRLSALRPVSRRHPSHRPPRIRAAVSLRRPEARSHSAGPEEANSQRNVGASESLPTRARVSGCWRGGSLACAACRRAPAARPVGLLVQRRRADLVLGRGLKIGEKEERSATRYTEVARSTRPARTGPGRAAGSSLPRGGECTARDPWHHVHSNRGRG